MTTESGGEHERLAPVIPLFGGPPPEHPERPAPSRTARSRPRSLPEPDPDPVVEAAVQALITAVDRRIATPAVGVADDAPPAPTPIARAAKGAAETEAEAGEESWHPTWSTDRRALDADDDSEQSADVELAEKTLLKRLRTRSLSVSEARGVLREFALDADAVEHVIASMDEYGYLDDAALAEQLVHAGADRKGQGRQVIAQTLAKRGIPRDVADAVLATLPDDDLERALEFARTKARSLRSLDRETALRRLTGQLARRGYGGSVAMTAARTALDEGSQGSSGVRFR